MTTLSTVPVAIRSDDAASGDAHGIEHVVDARGCASAALASLDVLRATFDAIIEDLGLRVLDQIWHEFPEPGGITGLALLSESHLTVHTFPETGVATFNLYCCRSRVEWPWAEQLGARLGATDVRVRTTSRG